MSITLPNFKNRKCLRVSFCGFVPAEEFPQRDEFPDLERALVAQYTRRAVFLRLVRPFPGDFDDKVHVHLELATKEWFTGKFPKPNSSADEILAKLSPFIGMTIGVSLEGYFRVSLADLPPIIRATLVETVTDDIQVTMTGGTLTVRGAPVHKISWELEEKTSGANVVLESRRTQRKLDESYLVDGLETLESAFKAFVLGEKRDG